MASLSLSRRQEIAREHTPFTDSVAGALVTHALWRVRNLESDPPANRAFAEAVLADTDRYVLPVMRLILHSAEQAHLEDHTALTDQQVTSMVEELFPVFVAVLGSAESGG